MNDLIYEIAASIDDYGIQLFAISTLFCLYLQKRSFFLPASGWQLCRVCLRDQPSSFRFHGMRFRYLCPLGYLDIWKHKHRIRAHLPDGLAVHVVLL